MQIVAVLESGHGNTNRLYATRLTNLQVLQKLAEMCAEEEAWIRTLSRLEGFMAGKDDIPVIVVRKSDKRAIPNDTVELWWNGATLEQYRLGELVDLFKIKKPKIEDDEIEEQARDWGIDYKPWETNLNPQDYARYGYEQGAKWYRDR